MTLLIIFIEILITFGIRVLSFISEVNDFGKQLSSESKQILHAFNKLHKSLKYYSECKVAWY